jgi:Uma2 family endonuclease
MTTTSRMARMFAHANGDATDEENREMHMATRVRRWTRADLERLPDDGNRYEVIEGELFVTPPPSTKHEELLWVMGSRLRGYVERAGIGRVHDGKSAMVTRDSHVEPDLLVRQRVVPLPERWDEMPVPLLVVEILSSSTRQRDLSVKKTLYMGAGVAQYWIVDATQRAIHVVRPGEERIERQTVRWEPAGADEAFELDVAGVFDEAIGPGTSEQVQR